MFVTTGYHNKKIGELVETINKLKTNLEDNTQYINKLKTKEVQVRVDKLPNKLLKKLIEVETGYIYERFKADYNGYVSFYGPTIFGLYYKSPDIIYQISIDELETKIERMKKLKCKWRII